MNIIIISETNEKFSDKSGVLIQKTGASYVLFKAISLYGQWIEVVKWIQKTT